MLKPRSLPVIEKFADAVLLLLFAMLGSIPATIAFSQAKYTFFYQNFTPEAVVWACGYGMRHPLSMSEQLSAFLLGEAQSFDCSTIDSNALGPVGIFATVQPCLTWLTAFLWRVLGVNQMALLPVVVFITSLYAAGCYALSRLFFGRLLAVAAAAFLCLSPVISEMSLSLRDYSKAPFFIWTVVFLILALRQRGTGKGLIFATLAGFTVGIGYGFRSDVAVIVPIGVLILAISAAPHFRDKPWRLLAPLVFLVATGLSALPVILQTNVFLTNVGTLTIQGTTENFRNFAGMKPAGYALGWAYSDELTLSEVASAERPKIPDWDAGEGQPLYGVSQAVKYSTSYLSEWAPMFAADFATQALKSAGWILSFPSFYIRSGMVTTHSPMAYSLPIYHALAKPWMLLLGLTGFVALLWRAYLHSRIEAVCIFLLLIFLMGIVGIQFAMRHAFYLEFIWVLSAMSLISVALKPDFSIKRASGFAIMLAVAMVSTGAIYLGLIQWQQSVLSREIATLLKQPRKHLETRPSLLQDGSVLHALPVPAQHREIIASESDSMTPAIRLIGIQWDVRAEADRLVVTVEGDKCPTGPLKLKLVYEKSKDIWQPMDADLLLDISIQGGSASAFFPAFYRPTQYFKGIVLPSSHSACSIAVERIDSDSALPVAMSGNFSGTDLVGPLQKGLGSFSSTSWNLGIITPAEK